MEANDITRQIIGAAMEVHSVVGPGLLESAYERCLERELAVHGLRVARQVSLPVIYRGTRVELGYRIDMLVEDSVIVEVKAVAMIADQHRAQLLSYLRLSDIRIGLLLNFHVAHMRDGIVRMVNRWQDQSKP